MHHSIQYAWPALPLSQSRNNLSVRCFTWEQELLTVVDRSSDWRSGESAKFSTCENYNSDGGDLTRGKWGPWLMVVQVSFLKCDRYSKVLLSQLMTSSFKGNKLYSLLFRFTEQKARLVRGTKFLFYSKPTGNHWTLTATSQAVSSGKSKFTALLYSLFPLSMSHPEKMFRHLALKENGHLGGEKNKIFADEKEWPQTGN